jgi:hypothetical protein
MTHVSEVITASIIRAIVNFYEITQRNIPEGTSSYSPP